MIIVSVHAENVLRYQELNLDNLPERGIIAISGQNESGKSTIGETICFGLFGRTFSIGPEHLEKIVRWGENHCSVKLVFKAEDTEYELTRFLDRDGNHSAKLTTAEEPEKPIARGVADVDDALFDILGYEFEEFIESFYLAQREIITPHPHSLAVKIMAGVAPLEYVASSLEEEIEQHNESLEDFQAEIETVETEMDELGFSEGRLARLEDSSRGLEAELRGNQQLQDELRAGDELYANNESRMQRAEASRGRSRFFRFITLLLAIAFGVAWGLLTQRPDLQQSVQLLEYLQQNIPNWQPIYVTYLGYTGIFFLVLGILYWIKASGVNGKVNRLREASAGLAGIMAEAHAVPGVEDSIEDEYDPDEDIPPMPPSMRPSGEEFAALYPRVEASTARSSEVHDYIERELLWLGHQIQKQQEQLQDMQHEIELENGRLRQAARLQEVIDALTDRAQGVIDKIELRNKAIELLEGASAHLSNIFNRDVRELVGKSLPLFTQNRYEHLHIDDELNVRVFSSDKRDFMDLEEVSSGTQRQIMLALRLALSQKLLNRTVRGKQFAFMDEPFAFFDEERTRHALLALNQLNSEISQTWIIAQAFPDRLAIPFALSIVCSRDIGELNVTGLQAEL